MLTGIEQTQHQWNGRDAQLDKWLRDRKSLLVSYCQIAGLPPYEKSATSMPGEQEVTQFCERLMDYISTAHFEIYEKLFSIGTLLSTNELDIIQKNTDLAVNFNDSATDSENPYTPQDFDKQLITLGESLENRFATEDEMIQRGFAE